MKNNHSDKRIDVLIMKNYSDKKIGSMLAEYYTEEQVPHRVMQAISEGMDKIDEAQKNGAVNNYMDKIEEAQKNRAVNNYMDKIDEAQKNGAVNNYMDKIEEAQKNRAVNNYMDKIDEAQKSGAVNKDKVSVRNFEHSSAGKNIRRSSVRAVLALAAAALLIFTALQMGPVRAAVEKLFAFIPGVGMVEEEKNSVMLYLDGRSLTNENEYISLCLDNAYVTDDGVQINYKLSLLGVPMDEADSLLAKEKNEAAYTDFLKKYNLTDYITIKKNENVISIKPNVKLNVNGTAVEETSGAVAGGSVDMSGFNFYKLDTTAIDPSTELSIQCGDLEISFHVKDYETYSSIDEVGSTQCLNNVVITAVPRWSDKKLKVDIYTNNGSIFDGISGYGYYLYNRETESCDEKAQPYVIIDDLFLPLAPMSGFDGTTLEFDLTGVEITEEMKKKAVLHIPSVSLYNYEERSVPVSIKKDKMLNEINKELQFEGGTLTVVSAERVADYVDGKQIGLDESNTLKLTLKFKPNESGVSLDSFGGIYYNSDNGFSWETDRQNNQIYVYINYDKPYYKIKTLKFVNPVYIYYDEYELTLR